MGNENKYLSLVERVLARGQLKPSRAGNTVYLPGMQLHLDVLGGSFPVLTTRKMHPKGVIGEALALVQTNATNISDFKERGCNYWDSWGGEDGSLVLDYSIKDALPKVIESIKKDPYSRRHIIDLWNDERLPKLSLPCCHYSYQFVVSGNYIDLVWTQRSADLAVGVPSDMMLATIYLRLVAAETNLAARDIYMNFGDLHVYEDHIEGLKTMLGRTPKKEPLLVIGNKPLDKLTNDDFYIVGYRHDEPVRFSLHV
jgi:thymidylate synthase